MDLTFYETYAEKCFRDAPPPCSSRCPFGLDVRKFVKKMQNGNYASAYRTYIEFVPFPGIISALCPAPCRDACVRARGDRAVSLRELEAACLEHVRDRKPKKYKSFQKPLKIAVIGGGLSGLSCAWRMSVRAYQVTVFEATNALGGEALKLMDPEVCRTEIENAFSIYECKFVMEHPVTSLEELAGEFDGIYIATGKGGDDFGLLSDGYHAETLGTGRPGVFLGGQRRGEMDVIDAACDGLHAANTIEVFLKIGAMDYNVPRDGNHPVDERFYLLGYGSDSASEESSGAEGFDVTAEANRCYICNCDKCYQVCPVMQDKKYYPPNMGPDITATLKPNMSKRTGVRVLAGCTNCGKCREVCPEHIDMGACLLRARKELKEDGHLAAGFHDYWMRDLDFTLSDEAYLVWRPEKDRDSEVVFFPGCQLGASLPDTVIDAYQYIAKTAKNAALYLGCCGIPAEWAGEDARRGEIAAKIREVWEELGRPTFLLACTACQSNLKRYCPEIPLCSLYQWMEEHPEELPAPAFAEEEAVHVFDPCGAAGAPEIGQAVRGLVARYGGRVINEKTDCNCCGFGGHIYPASPKVFMKFAERAIAGADDAEEMIAYCANCRDIFVAHGKECRHVLDLVFGRAQKDRKSPTLGTRRENRKFLKRHFTGETIVERKSPFTFRFTQEALDQMTRLLILEEEVIRTVEACEESGRTFCDETTDLFYAHYEFENMTVWAVYRREQDQIEIADVYSHRVRVKE